MEYQNVFLNQLFQSQEQENLATFEHFSQNVTKVACALANAKGGVILIGFDDAGRIVGIDAEEIKKVILVLSNEVNPSLPYTFNVLQESGKDFLIISIWEGGSKPYNTANSFFVQIGDCVTRASLEQVDRLFEHRRQMDESWERKPNSQIEYRDLSERVCNELRSHLVALQKCSATISIEEMCKILGMQINSVITNAGVVVLAKRPCEYLPQTRIRVSMYGEGGLSELLNVHLYDGNLVDTINEISDYVSGIYPSRMEIVENKRVDFEALPKVAFREGLLNAVVHRTYDAYNSSVVVNIYSDCLEIVNSGELPEQISVEDLGKNHLSILRNPDIANVFFILKYIEMAGSGTRRIINECKSNRCVPPIWISENGYVTLRFPAIRHGHAFSQQRDWEAFASSLSADSEVAASLAKILEYLSKNSNVKLKSLVVVTGKSYPTVQRYMQILKIAGLARYVGSARSGGWFSSL